MAWVVRLGGVEGGTRTTAIWFGVGTVLAGANSVGIRFSNRELDPFWGATLRFTLAAAVLGGLMALMRLEVPSARELGYAALYGVLSFGAAYALLYAALVHVHAGLAQTLLALVPLLTLLIAAAEGQEVFRLRSLLGALVAVAGVAAIAGTPMEGEVPLLAVLGVVVTAAFFAQGTVLIRHVQMHPVTLNAYGMGVGGAMLFVVSLIAGESFSVPSRGATWLALAYLVFLGSVAVFVIFADVLRHWEASRAAYGFVLTPFVTVVLSAWLDDEPLGWGLAVGGALVLVGVYVGALRDGAREERPPAA
jgi:drug/metabolite transporter (DMT)-like permease